MTLRNTLAAGAALLPLALLSTPAFAQSTGSVDFDEEIVVTGATASDVAGIQSPDTSKAKSVLGQEVIARQNPGQTILDTINLVPGVNFTNNDAYGSSGGQLTIRGFSEDRISLTFDGVPLNDSGNYAIYSNQQLDPELIEQVNVNLGSTDVDSPTAAATGSTVNYRTITPTEDFGVRLSGSAGEYKFFRVFGLINTGEFTPFGTRAFLSASSSSNDNPFNNYGRVRKKQFNGRIWQPIGSNGDFVSVAGHYNENRTNFFGSLPLRLDANRVVGSGSGNRFPIDSDEREYNINYPCQTDVPQAGVQDVTNTCGTEFDRRYNPSNTGNIRGSSKFTLADGVVLTVDPSYQYVKANGGGTVTGREGFRTINGVNYTGFIGGNYYFGRDLNGDGDILDTCRNAATAGQACSSTASATNTPFAGVTLLAPSQTQTHRYGVIANLRWDINDAHTIRVGFTYDRARHRQTGELMPVQLNGEPFDVFPVNNPLVDANGVVVQKRNRLSYAILTQVSGEYRGEWADGKLVTTIGIRAPFFKRDLNNYCFTTAENGNVDCLSAALSTGYAAANPTVQGPQQRVLKYDDILPNIGLMFKPNNQMSIFANYSKGLQVPGTDSLYNAFFFAPNTASARPNPETSDNFDLGVRYRTSNIQAQVSGWFTKYNDRLASAYDPVLDRNVYRNLGRVDKYGIDGSIAYQPISNMSLYVFGSWMKSEIKDDIQSGNCTPAQVADVNIPSCTTNGQPLFIRTAGKREAGAPEYSFGGSVRGTLGPVELGITGKRTGGRFIYDTNLPIYAGTAAAPTIVYPAKTNAYWLVNLDARMSLEWAGLNDKTFFQLNVYNLFDSLYVGKYTTSLNQGNVIGGGNYLAAPASVPFAQIGAPRTISGTLTVGF